MNEDFSTDYNSHMLLLTCLCMTQKWHPYETLSFILEGLSVSLLCSGRKRKLTAELSWYILIYTYKVSLSGTNIAYVDDAVLSL